MKPYICEKSFDKFVRGQVYYFDKAPDKNYFSKLILGR
jgi:hypothetical protein